LLGLLYAMAHVYQEIGLSATPKINTAINSEQLASLAQSVDLNIAASDMPQVLQHFQLLTQHAERVLAFPLDEMVEMAGQYRP
jgi:Protein of unknown function (DUF4089)